MFQKNMDFLKNNKKGMKEKRSRKDGVGGGGSFRGGRKVM